MLRKHQLTPLADNTGTTRQPLAEADINAYRSRPKTHKTCNRKRPWTADCLPESDPDRTHTLWLAVSAEKRRRMSTRRGVRDGQAAGGENTRVGTRPTLRGRRRRNSETHTLHTAESVPLDDDASIPESVIEDEERSSARSRNVRPYNSHFRMLVLAPCKVDILDTRTIVPNAYTHFGTSRPQVSYRQLPEIGAANVCLEIDGDDRNRIAKHYLFMQQKKLCEDEYATYAKETFFKGEAREIQPPEDRRWRSERMLQLVCRPLPGAFWCEPPVLSPNLASAEYPWDVRPDCAYWLSLRGFNSDYSHCVSGACFVYKEWITCPYLTIEFKRDDWKPDVATTQAATAATIALYNRYQLRIRAGLASTNEFSTLHSPLHDISSIKHYALTFTAATFVTWLLQPAIGPSELTPMEWHGCKMSRLSQGDCTDPSAVGRLETWINEIHRWGLSMHASLECTIVQQEDEKGIDEPCEGLRGRVRHSPLRAEQSWMLDMLCR